MEAVMDERFWDEMYNSKDQVWSGAPNGVLVAEVTGLPPGQALDVGCGEGGDARWLAERGWRVTAIDISRVALERAAAHAADVANIAWAQADVAAAPPPAEAFDLVSAHYFPLHRQDDHAALRGLLAAVAPGGTLLVVGHELADQYAHHDNNGVDPDDFYQPGDIAAFLDKTWTVEINESRARTTPPPPGTHFVHDVVLRARRLP